MGKRKYQPDDRLEAYMERLRELYVELSDNGGDDLAGLAILHLSQEARMTIADLQKLKASSPSFCAAKWETVAPALGLRADVDIAQLDPFTVPIAMLPPSFHRDLMKNALRWMDVYQEPPSHKREETRVRLLEGWYVPICSLFNGRLVDKPENPMPETPETSCGKIEHEVFLFSNLILLVIEMNITLENAWDYFAQVLLKLVSAMQLKRDRDLCPQPPIYAMLSDLRDFYFLSYDGTKFQCMAQISIPQRPRAEFMKGMTQVSDILFSLLLNGYVEILAAVEKRSIKSGDEGDHTSFPPGTPVIDTTATKVPKLSLGSWSKALLKAREAQTILVEPDLVSEDTWENDSRCGMHALNESLRHLVKTGSLEDWDEDKSNIEFGGIMDQVIETHRSRKGFNAAGTRE